MKTEAQSAQFSKSFSEYTLEIKPLIDRGVKILVEAPKPVFRVSPFRCMDWFNRDNPICEPGFEMQKDELLEYRRPVQSILEKVAEEVPNLRIWDPFPVLCPGEKCSALLNGKPIFYDPDHITPIGNLMVFDDFERSLRKL